VNGHPNGQAIFAVAAVTAYTQFFGFGIGQVAGNAFYGTTNFGEPFVMFGHPGGFSGEIGIVYGGYAYDASAYCTQIW